MPRRRLAAVAWMFGLIFGGAAQATPQWNYGPFESYWHFECTTGIQEVLTQAQAGYYGDGATPRVGEVYYTTSLLSVVGNACVGGSQVVPEIFLPQQSVLAISAAFPVRCVYTSLSTGAQTELPRSECPQTPSAGPNGGYAFYQPQQSTFPVAYGSTFELWVPVLSKKVLSGIGSGDYFQAGIKVITESTYTQFPSQGVFVFPNPPAISYGSPSTTAITNNTATSRGVISNHYTQGSLYADLGTATSYSRPGMGPWAIGDYDWGQSTVDWTGLTAGTTYHWRLRFVSSNGVTTVGADQTFTTTGTPPVATYPLAISVTSGGNVTVSPNQANYAAGTQITFTAVPDAWSYFVGWTVDGVAAGSGNPLVHTVTQFHLIGATFATPPAGADAGTSAPSDAGTTPGADAGTAQPTPDGGAIPRADGGGGGDAAPQSGCGGSAAPGMMALMGAVLIGSKRRRGG
ncbi:MAG: hypothetical protein M3Y59_10335 [Myxococcota bacterium]|nr:hypothetical protein [Myxococcota bacterium]